MTVVAELSEVLEVRVRCCTSGFESVAVRAVTWPDEDRLLAHFYARPARTSARAFADALMAACLVPRRHASDVAQLPDDDRARVRRAVVTALGQRRAWRELYRSHLTPDERLFTVMLARHRRREAVREHFMALREEWAERAAGAADAAGAFSRSFGQVAEVKLPNFALPTVRVPLMTTSAMETLKSPMALGLQSALSDMVRSLSVFKTAVPGSFRDQFVSPLPAHLYEATSSAAVIKAINSPGLAAVKTFSDSLSMQVSPSLMAGLATRSSVSASWTTALPSSLIGKVAAGSALSGFGGIADLARQFNGGLLGQITLGLEGFDLWRRVTEPMQRLRDAVDEVAAWERRWEQRALFWLVDRLFGVCDIWDVRGLVRLVDADVEEALLLAIEMSLDAEFVRALRIEVAKAPHLNSSQRIHLDHVLEHAGEQEYVRAVGSLYLGLEGAFWQAAYALSAVTLTRTRVDNPKRSVGFESMVRLLPLEAQFQTLVVRELWGTTGNVFRHGEADRGERRQVLLGVAALCGWLEQFASVPALEALASAMGEELHRAIAAVSGLAPGDVV